MDKKVVGSSSNSKLSDYEIMTKLGQGSFGIVYKVKRKNDQRIYVLKQIDTSRMSASQRKEAVHEATILSKLNSPYIVKYYDSFTDKNNINIIMEYCENGDLGIYLKRQMNKMLPEQKIWKFFVEMCLGIQYLHTNKVLHRDIKTINMFLTKEDKIKIGDLGVAKMLNQTANFAHTVVGTPYYLSPELCEEKPYNHKSDIWSLGCVLYELCTLKHPFESNNQGALILKIVRGKYNPIPTTYSRDLSGMVDSCLCKDYKKRPSIHEILEKSIIIEKAQYFCYAIPKEIDIKASSQQQQQQRQQSQVAAQQQQQQQKQLNDAAVVVQQRQQQQQQQQVKQQAPPAQSAVQQREKQYYQQLQQQQKPVQSPVVPKRDDKPVQGKPSMPSSYVDPTKKAQPILKDQQYLLNNNKFDAQQLEKRAQQNQIQQQVQQKRPTSNQNPRQAQPVVQKQAVTPPVLQQPQPVQKQVQPQQQYQPQLAAVQNQRVKSGAPSTISRQAQMAQKQGQRILKQGDPLPPQIFKPNVKQLQPQQSEKIVPSQPLSAGGSGKHKNSLSQEVQDVMNLPDSMDKKKNQGMGMKSNQDMIHEMQQKKRDVLSRVNNKYSDNIAQKSAEELHEMRMVMPSGQDNGTGQKQIDDDEFAELLGNDYVQPSWNVEGQKQTHLGSGMRETCFVPTYEESKQHDAGFDDDFYVHHDRDNSPFNNNKMKTIKEEDEGRFSGSDTGYFSHDEEFNNRDEPFDSDEEKEYERRKQQLLAGDFGNDNDDEDNQPYDAEEEEKRIREQFGDDDEYLNDDDDDDDEYNPSTSAATEVERMSMTMQAEKVKTLRKEVRQMRQRQEELKFKIKKKTEEGIQLVGAALFQQCYKFFCDKATNGDDLSEKDMKEIEHFVEQHIAEEKSIWLTSILFQAFSFDEEYKNLEINMNDMNRELEQLE